MAARTVERTALHEFNLDGQPVKPGQVVKVNRAQFNKLVAAGCIYDDDDANAAVPTLSVAGEVGTVIGEAQAESAADAGNSAHHNGDRVGGGQDGTAADLLAAAAEKERARLEAGVEADAIRAREDAAAADKAKAEKAKADADKAAIDKAAADSARADADKAKADADKAAADKIKADAAAAAKTLRAGGAPSTSALPIPPQT